MICASSESCPDEGRHEWGPLAPDSKICQETQSVRLRQCHPE
jgi:hypothetical protein